MDGLHFLLQLKCYFENAKGGCAPLPLTLNQSKYKNCAGKHSRFSTVNMNLMRTHFSVKNCNQSKTNRYMLHLQEMQPMVLARKKLIFAFDTY